MKDLGITEDMVYGDLVQTVRSDSYGKSSGKKSWTGRYQGGRRKIGARERESSSSSHYDKEPSRSLSPPRHVVDHMDIVSSSRSVGGASLPKISAETENNESQEYPSSNMYGMRSGETGTCQERPSSQASDNSGLIERDGFISVSLSQASHGTRDPVHSSGKKRRLISGESCVNSQLHTKKQREGENDDTIFKEKGKLKNYNLKSGYSKRQLDRRSRGSPKRGESDCSGDENPKQDPKYSPRNENLSLHQSPVQAEANTKVSAAAQIDDMLNQIHPMDVCSNFPEVPNELVKQELLHRADYDQVESQTSAQLDTHQTESKMHSPPTTMSCTPPISTFDFERDETPPAEIVEATAEWCRTQNLPPNLSSVSLQHVFQYYQSSLAVDGTKNKDEGGLWHSPIWPGMFQQRNQSLGQDLAATSPGVTNPAYSYQSANQQNVDPIAECSSSGSDAHVHFNALSKPVSNSEQTSVATVLHGAPTCSYSAHEPWSSQLHNAMDRDSRQLSDGEVQEHLKMFLNHQETKAIEHSFNSERIPTSGTQAGVEATSDVTGCTGSEQVNHSVRYYRQQGKETSAANFNLMSPCHSRDQNIYATPENQEEASLISNVTLSGMQQERNQRLSQNLSNQSYPLNEHVHVHRESGAFRHALTRDHLPTLGCAATMDSVKETTACIAEKDVHHKYGPGGGEPVVSRDQWKEGEHKLSQQHNSKGLWRTEALGCVQEPLRREKAYSSVETSPYIVHTCRPLDSSLAMRSEVHNGDTSASLTYTFSNQASLDSLYQATSIAASQGSTDMSCIHEGEVRELQLQCLNEPTAREPYQYCSPSRRQVENHRSDLTSSPLSSNQQADMDELRMLSPDFHRRQQQRLNTDRSGILPMSRLKMRSMYTPLQELSKLSINPVSRDKNGPDKCDLCVSQKTSNNPNKRDQPQRLRCEELVEKDMDGAEELSSKKLVQEKCKSTCTEQSLGKGSDGAEITTQISGINIQTFQSKQRKLVAHKYKHLQKYYYKVN